MLTQNLLAYDECLCIPIPLPTYFDAYLNIVNGCFIRTYGSIIFLIYLPIWPDGLFFYAEKCD